MKSYVGSFLTPIKNIIHLPHFSSLKIKDYRYTWAANMFSGAGMWTFIVAVSWFVLEHSNLSGWVGIITFASMIPFLIISPIGGLLADRMDRKNLSLITLIAGAITTAALATLSIIGIIELWHVAIITFVAGTFRATQEPAIQALIPNQVPREILLNAITLNASTRHGARFFGLLVAAPLMATDYVGIKGVLVLSSLFYVAGTILMLKVRTASIGDRKVKQRALSGILDGFAYIYTNKIIALFIILVAFHCALVMSFESILPVLTKETLHAKDGSYLGYMVMGFGAGALVSTFLMAGVKDEKAKGQLLFWTGLLSGITPIALSFSVNISMAILASIAMGSSQAMFMALTNTYVQMLAPDQLRGRISSLYILHAGGIMAFANLGYGFMADQISAPPILLVTGLLFIVFLAGLSASQPQLRKIYGTGQTVPV